MYGCRDQSHVQPTTQVSAATSLRVNESQLAFNNGSALNCTHDTTCLYLGANCTLLMQRMLHAVQSQLS